MLLVLITSPLLAAASGLFARQLGKGFALVSRSCMSLGLLLAGVNLYEV